MRASEGSGRVSEVVRQARAAAVLLYRYLARRAVRAGAGPGHQPSRAPWFLVLSLVWALYVGNLLWSRFDDAARAGELTAVGWQLIGLALELVGFGLVELAPELGRIRPPLRIALLDELPFTTAARLVLVWFRNPLVPALTIVGALAWMPGARGEPVGVLAAIGLALALYLAATTGGYALGTWIRVVSRARGRRLIGIGSLVLVLVGVQLLVFSDLLVAVAPPSPVIAAARAIVHAEPELLAVALLAIWGAALGLIALAERRGYDRLDASAPGVRRSSLDKLDARGVERLLTRREGGLGLAITGWLFFAAVAIGVGFALVRPPPAAIVSRLSLGASVAIAYLGAVIALSRAGQAVRRDTGVRPLLAPLPIAPWQTLEGKVSAIRWVVLPLILSALPPLVLALWHAGPLGHAAPEMLWRFPATIAAVWLGTDAAVSIAFLTGGVGLPGVKSLGAPTSFAVQLLLLPMLAAAAAPDPIVALASVGAVFAIAIEARRAAHRAVRWLDDAADDIERETTVWRALLALAAFYAVQALGGELLGLGDLAPAVRGALTFIIAAVVLVVLTLQGRRALGPLRWRPTALVAWALGPLAGATSAAVALGFVALVGGLGVTPPPSLDLGAGVVALAFALTIAAPIAEEVFFRGWLQSAIAQDLPAHRRRWAFVIAAVAFALAHVGTWLLPQLVLGLAAGALYARWGGLAPAMLAHATHNAIVIAWAAVSVSPSPA
ncbi:MAG: CPBP family intramembrane metalloprotease [Deltaproteobacteria bacterium]|nr:CPBP family intramembrane metalloprotease [Deltaproteobacteria bacterium]